MNCPLCVYTLVATINTNQKKKCIYTFQENFFFSFTNNLRVIWGKLQNIKQ